MPDRPRLFSPIDEVPFPIARTSGHLRRMTELYAFHPSNNYKQKNFDGKKRYLQYVEREDDGIGLIRAASFLAAVYAGIGYEKASVSGKYETFIGKNHEAKVDPNDREIKNGRQCAIGFWTDFLHVIKPYRFTTAERHPAIQFTNSVNWAGWSPSQRLETEADALLTERHLREVYIGRDKTHYQQVVDLRRAIYAQYLLARGMNTDDDKTNIHTKRKFASPFSNDTTSARQRLARQSDEYRILTFVGEHGSGASAREIKKAIIDYNRHERDDTHVFSLNYGAEDNYDDILRLLLLRVRSNDIEFIEPTTSQSWNFQPTSQATFVPNLTKQGQINTNEILKGMTRRDQTIIATCLARARGNRQKVSTT